MAVMIYTTLANAHIKRNYLPTYGWTQQTPKDMFLDPAWDRSVDIYPGMVAMKTEGENVTLINVTGVPLGFFGTFIGGYGIDEPRDSGINAVPVWVQGPDAEAEVLAPAFDQDATWTEPGDGTVAFVYAYAAGAKRGRLAPAGAGSVGNELTVRPVARLLSVDGPSQITIGGLAVGDV